MTKFNPPLISYKAKRKLKHFALMVACACVFIVSLALMCVLYEAITEINQSFKDKQTQKLNETLKITSQSVKQLTPYEICRLKHSASTCQTINN